MTFVKRPLAVITLSFFISFCVLLNFDTLDKKGVLIVFGAVFCLSVPLAVLSKKARVLAVYAALAGVAVVAASIYATAFTNADDLTYLCGESRECILTVTEKTGNSAYYHNYEVVAVPCDGKDKFKTLVSSTENYEIGDILKADISFYLPEEDAVFDEKSYCLSLGVKIKGEIENAEIIGKDTTSFSIKIKLLNLKLSDIIHAGFEGDTAEIADAVVLGNKTSLSDEIKRDFSRLGISHLLAISGMHISFICSGFSFILKNVRINRKVICILTVFLMLFYMALTGFSPSVVRASVLCIMMSVIYVIGISYDGITCLGVCGCIMVLIDPFCAYSVGMQLSFCSYIGCLASAGTTEKLRIASKATDGFLRKAAKNVLSSVLFTVYVVCFTMPVSWLYFGSTSIIAPLSNLIFIPAFSIVLYIAVAALACYPVTWLFYAVSKVGTVYIGLILKLSSCLSSIRGITVSTKYTFSFCILALLAACVVFSATLHNKFSVVFRIGMVVLIAAYTCGVVIYNGNLENYTEVTRCGGKNNEALIIISGGESSIVDFSNCSRSDVKREIHFSEERRITEIDSFVLTRYSGKTVSGIEYLTDSTFVKTVYLPTPKSDDRQIYSEVVSVLEEENIIIEEYSPGKDVLTLGNSSLFVNTFYESTSSKKTSCAKVKSADETLIYLGKGWNSARSRVAKDFPTSSCDCLFLGSKGFDSSTFSLVTDAEIYLFSASESENKNLIPSLKESNIYDVTAAVTVRLK